MARDMWIEMLRTGAMKQNLELLMARYSSKLRKGLNGHSIGVVELSMLCQSQIQRLDSSKPLGGPPEQILYIIKTTRGCVDRDHNDNYATDP